MLTLRVDPDDPHAAAGAAALERAAGVLRAGGLVAFPTETVYGLGANALDDDAVRRVYDAKGRPPTNPMIVHVADADAARALAASWPEEAERLAARFWPGPLTLVVPKRPEIGDIVTAGLPNVGIRVPRHPVAQAVLRAAGVPVAAPSANRFTGVSPTTADHVADSLGDAVDLIVDGGPCDVGIESTVVSLVDGFVVLRPGMISVEELREVVPQIRVRASFLAIDVAHPSPGLSHRHYAPRARLRIESYRGAPSDRTAALLYASDAAPGAARVTRMPRDPEAYARRLYAELHAADAAGCDFIIVEPLPTEPAWSAIRDRLARAAASDTSR